jgi:hypothetical protein
MNRSKHNTVDEHFFKYINNNLDLCTLDNDPDFSKKPDSDDECIGTRYLSNCVSVTLKSGYNYKNGYVRLSLNENTILPLKEISRIAITCYNNYNTLYHINLLLNIILMDKYGYKITIIDTKEFLDHNTESSTNSKYQFENENRYYLDIPLFEEFYKYGQDIVYNNIDSISYEIYGTNCIEALKGNETTIKFEHITKYTLISEINLIRPPYNLLSSSCGSRYQIKFGDYGYTYGSKIIKLTMNANRYKSCKFIFMVLEKKSYSIPQIDEITFNISQDPINISLDNVIQYELDNLLIYGISTDPMCDMHRFSDICSESINDNNTYFSYTKVSTLDLKFNQDIDLEEFSDIRLIYVNLNLEFHKN